MKRTSPSPSYVDPSSLSLPSPLSDDVDVSSPAPAASSSTPMSATPSTSTQPSRKRPRADTSPEEKREARAHRNRIAAQNSRDRRKAQFSQLEERVQALQRENEQLRAELQRERERRDNAEKEKENAELKERVKSLEQAWEPVLKAFQSQGLPSSLFPSKSSSSSTQTPDPKPDPPTTTFPVLIESPPVLPLTPLSVATTPSTVYNQPALNDGSIRHLARVASATVNSVASLQRMDPSLHRPCPPSISTRRFSSRKRSSIILRTRRQITASNTGSLKCCQATGMAQQVTPSQRRRLLAYLLVTIARNYNISNQKPPPRGDGFNLGLEDDMDMVMEMDRLLDLLPETIDNSRSNNEEFQDLLASVLDDSTVVESREWSSSPHLGTPLSVSGKNSTSLVV